MYLENNQNTQFMNNYQNTPFIDNDQNTPFRENVIYIISWLNILVSIFTVLLIIMRFITDKLNTLEKFHNILLKIFLLSINLYLIIFFNPFYTDDIHLSNTEKKEIFIASILILINYVLK